MSDKEFDALFKKAADHLEVPYNPKGWKRMQKRLNKAGGFGYYFRRIMLGLGVLLLLLGTGWWVQDNWFQEEQQGKIELSAANSISFSDAPPSPPKVSLNNSSDANLSEDESPIAAEEVSDQLRRSQLEDKTMKDKRDAEEAYDAAQHGVVSQENEHRSSVGIGGNHEGGLVFLNANGIEGDTWQLPTHALTLVKAEAMAPQDVIKDTKSQFVNRWGMSFGLSPDLSGVGLHDIHHVSTKAAIRLEYFVWPSLSISSGVIFSNKVYSASPEDYAIKYQYNNAPIGINGECEVLDIPFNLKWYALRAPKSSIFISGGLSSYMMLTEDYEYLYKEKGKGKYPNYYSRHYQYKHENDHFFKVANFSLGYERRLGRQWAAQLEPFIKLPLAGVGEGKLKLATLGTFLSIHYRWGKH